MNLLHRPCDAQLGVVRFWNGHALQCGTPQRRASTEVQQKLWEATFMVFRPNDGSETCRISDGMSVRVASNDAAFTAHYLARRWGFWPSKSRQALVVVIAVGFNDEARQCKHWGWLRNNDPSESSVCFWFYAELRARKNVLH